MAVSPADLARTLRQRDAVRRASWQERAAELRATARRVADGLAERWGASEVWLFGSLVVGGGGGEPDIDLAVRGIAPRDFFTAGAWAEQVAGARIDVVDLTSVPPAFAEAILADGIRLR